MIRISHFRPVRPLCDVDGCQLRANPLALAVACYKGDAAQTQTSEQTGAQSGGVATKGSNNTVKSYSGTSVNSPVNDISVNVGSASASGPSGQDRTSSKDNTATGSSGVNVTVASTDYGAIQDAATAIQAALNTANAAVTETAKTATAQAEQQAAVATAAIQANDSSMATVKKIAIGAAVIGVAALGFQIFNKTK